MTTLEELIYYCKEPKPVGAVLLSGEWGCGKTYLIEHDLKDMLKEKFYILRISLFGITSIEEIHKSVREKWLEAYYESKNISNVAEKIQKGKEIIAKVEGLPDIIKGVAATNWTSFIEIKEKIGDKSVVLVFDDLERCCLNSVDVLGGINDYCENQKFHTIVIANQEKMCTNIEEHQINAEIEVKDEQEKKIDKCERKKLDLKICVPPKTAPGAISYSEIKEKIIQRTVKYIPDYKSIICAVIEELQFQDIQSSGKEYKKFVKECENGILELFAPDIENGAIEENENLHSSSQEKKRSRKSNLLSTHERPHNIRSLKCAISDFYRVYIILKENDFSDIDKWFYSFVSYVLSYKADIAKEGVYGTIFSDEEVRKLYPAFQNQYIFNAVKKWILRGVWNKEEIYYEIEMLKKREKAKTPAEIVKTYRIVDVDEDIINAGYEEVLDFAYKGLLTLDEYVQFIMNSYWLRIYGFSLPIRVEWDRVQKGIQICIENIIESQPEGQILHTIIGTENRESFTPEEWETYQVIEAFRKGDVLIFSKNRSMYISEMEKDAMTAFVKCQNKRFKAFDTEMAIATAYAYAKSNNSSKNQFGGYFKSMWSGMIVSQEADLKICEEGFSKLQELLEEQKKELQEANKTFGVVHTDSFIDSVKYLLNKVKTEQDEKLENSETHLLESV